MIESLIIPIDAYPYLVAQRGALDDMKGDIDTWMRKYCEVVFDEFQSIEPYLPRDVEAILDVGSGMGGIDAILNSFYGGDIQITLLDGIDDPPKVSEHRKTFNDMRIARIFLKANGAARVNFIDANDAHRRVERRYDLIVSFKSWCFHVEPARYIDLVAEACHADTVLILDVRRDKPEWLAQLQARFLLQNEIYRGPKSITCRFATK